MYLLLRKARPLAFGVLLFLVGQEAIGQQLVVGRVIDGETGSPLEGVLIKSSSDSTISSANGSFSLSTDESMIFSSFGYELLEVDDFSIEPIIAMYPKIYALDGLVVTSSFDATNRSVSSVPVNIINKKDLEAFDPTIITSSLNMQPGVFMQSGALNTNRITIRGIGGRSPFSTNKVRAYLGEIPLTNGTGETTLEDIDLNLLGRVEIIKGPSSTLFGSGLGGVMLLYPELDASTSEVSIDNTVGSYGLNKTNVVGSFSHSKGLQKVFYSRLQSDGYRENNEVDREVIGVLSSTYQSNSEDHFFGYYLRQKAFIPSSVNFETFRESPREAAFTWGQSQGNEDYEKVLMGYSHVHDLGAKTELRTAVFGTYLSNDESRPFNILQENTFGVGSRIRLNTQLTEGLKLFTGGEFFLDNYNWSTFENLYQDFPGQGSVRGSILQQNAETRRYFNLFSELSYQFKKTQLSIGVNYNESNYDLSNAFSSSGVDVSGDYDYDPILTPKFGLSHKINANMDFFASVSEGFSTPSLEETLTPDGALNTDIRPERGVAFETGLRANFRGWSLESTIYQMNIRDLLVARRTAEDAFIGINAGKTTHRGVELLLTGQILSNEIISLDTRWSYAFNGFKFKEFIDEDADFSGNDLTGFPSYNLTAQVNLAYRGKGRLVITEQSVGEIPITDDNSVVSTPYHLLFAKVSWSERLWKSLDLTGAVGINNLLDDEYASMVLINASGFGGNAPRYYYPGLPRNYFAQLKLSYSFR